MIDGKSVDDCNGYVMCILAMALVDLYWNGQNRIVQMKR
jgi:hypothetical protein